MNLSGKRFIRFCIVGASGVGVNYIVYKGFSAVIWNDLAWLIGILVSASTNYILNEMFTFNIDDIRDGKDG